MTIQPSWKALTAAEGVPGVPRTATSTATPTASPTCRSMLTTAEPVANECGGSEDAPVDMNVGRVSPTPMPVMSIPGSICPA
jgi:hypothetical protein